MYLVFSMKLNTSRQNFGPLLKVYILVSYIYKPTKLRGAKGIRDLLSYAKILVI